jgi:hypothetical protein
MEDNKLILNGELLALSSNDNGDLIGKFLICPLDESNLNGVGLRESDLSQDELLGLATRPVQCKVIDRNGTLDFGSHEAKLTYVKDENGNLVKKYVFDTQSVGYHTEVSVENIEIDGITKRCIVAIATIWARYENVISVINRLGESLHTSWEIAYSEYYMDEGIKWIKGLNWLSNCLLGSNICPAYGDAGLLEVAEEDQEIQLSNAIIEDNNKIEVANKINEPNIEQFTNTIISNQTDENSVDNKLNNENSQCNEGGNKKMANKKKSKQIENSSLTIGDVYQAIYNALWDSEYDPDTVIIHPVEQEILIHQYGDLEENYIQISYTINEDGTVTLGDGTCVAMVFMPQSTYNMQCCESTLAKEKATKELDEANSTCKKKDEEMSELKKTIETQKTELSSKISSIVDLGKNISEKETVIAEKDELLQTKELELSELKPFKEELDKINAEKEALEIAEKKEAFKNEYLGTKLISEKDLEIAEVKEAIDTMDNSKIEIFIAQKVIAKAKAGKPQVEVSEIVKEQKVEVVLSSVNDDSNELNFSEMNWK